MIGWFMNEVPSTSKDVPAQRVINSKGELTGSWAFGQRGRMRSLLEAEGIVFSSDERVDLKRYGWDPSLALSEEERERIMDGAAADQIDISERLLHLLLNDKASPMRDVQNKE
jgi:methylated-DNA-protein-cysteine methyltransferase related protein